jgi:hypothetical protein
MTVRVRSLQSGKGAAGSLQTNFSDNFNRANDNSLGPNWIRLLGGNDVAGVNGDSWATGFVQTNQCVIQGRGVNNPSATLFTTWVPVPVFNFRTFNAPRYFVQATFVAAVGIAVQIGVRMNQSHEAGPTTNPNGQDGYSMPFNGRLDKQTNGSAAATIGANTVANGTARMEVVNSGTQCTITTFVNAVQVNQVTELAAAFPIMRGWPFITMLSVGGAPPTANSLTLDDFSCGVF